MSRNIFGIGEKSSSEDGSHPRILNANFNSDGTLLGGIELKDASHAVAQHIAQSIVAEHHGKHQQQKGYTVCQQVRANRHDNATHNKRKSNDTNAWHVGLQFLESVAMSKKVIAEKTDHHGADSHVENVQEHAHRIHIDAGVCKPQD